MQSHVHALCDNFRQQTMLKTILTISLILLISLVSDSNSAEDNYTPEQKKGLAQVMGIILTGFSKQDVLDTFSFTDPEIWHTDDGQEVWYYPAPEAQNIYFINDTVDEIKYTTWKRRNNSPASKKKIDL